ncbi:MAG: hypothetical protein U0441_37295 [Polyangiaceae bacterium]
MRTRSACFALAAVSAVTLLGSASFAGDPPPPPLPPATTAQPAAPPAGQPTPGYGPGAQPPPGYGQPPPGYGQSAPGYGQPPPGYYPAPGYGPPPGYGQPYYQQQDDRPRTLPYSADEPIPAGYHVSTRIRKGLVGGGAGLMGGLWFLSVLVAAAYQDSYNKDQWIPLFFPVGGPFAAMATLHSSDFGTMTLLLDGFGQAGGLTMLILGAALPEKRLVRDDLGGVAGFQITPSVSVRPVVAFHNVGITGTF